MTRIISSEAAAALPVHPAANLMPRMSASALDQLRDSIHREGQQTPVVLLNGAIIDGRHRRDVCVLLSRELIVVDSDLTAPEQFVVATNLVRRHLTESQKAIIGGRMVTTTRGRRAGSGEITQRDAAVAVGVSQSYIQMAQYVLTHGTEQQVESIFNGAASLNTVYRQMRQAAAPARPPREVLIAPITEVVAQLPRELADAPATALVQRIVEQQLDPAAWVRSLPSTQAAALVTALESFAREAFNVLDEEQDIGAAPALVDDEDAESNRNVRVQRGGSRVGGASEVPF